MIARLIEQDQAVRVVVLSSHLVPTWQDVDVWKGMNESVSPLANLTDIISCQVNTNYFIYYARNYIIFYL